MYLYINENERIEMKIVYKQKQFSSTKTNYHASSFAMLFGFPLWLFLKRPDACVYKRYAQYLQHDEVFVIWNVVYHCCQQPIKFTVLAYCTCVQFNVSEVDM